MIRNIISDITKMKILLFDYSLRSMDIFGFVTYRINSIRDLILEEGLLTLLKTCGRNFIGFPCERIYLYRHTIKERNAEEFMPSIQDFEDFILHDNKEMAELELKGYKFTSRKESTRNALSHGVIVFCVFVE